MLSRNIFSFYLVEAVKINKWNIQNTDELVLTQAERNMVAVCPANKFVFCRRFLLPRMNVLVHLPWEIVSAQWRDPSVCGSYSLSLAVLWTESVTLECMRVI